jgi:hypothetical protein
MRTYTDTTATVRPAINPEPGRPFQVTVMMKWRDMGNTRGVFTSGLLATIEEARVWARERKLSLQIDRRCLGSLPTWNTGAW